MKWSVLVSRPAAFKCWKRTFFNINKNWFNFHGEMWPGSRLGTDTSIDTRQTLVKYHHHCCITFSFHVMLFCVCVFVCVLCQRLDIEKETIELVHTRPTETHDLCSRIPTDTPRYHFFLYKHLHEGVYLECVGQYQCTLFTCLIHFPSNTCDDSKQHNFIGIWTCKYHRHL